MTSMVEIEREIAQQHLLTHPFYLAWTHGTLPRAALLDYARQYYAFEVRLPRFLTALHARAEEREVRTALLSNAWDEEHGESNHGELWLRFAEALGLSRSEVVEAIPNETTQALIDAYWEVANEAPVAAGVAALYAYESQLPAVADAKIAGLKKHYGFSDGSGTAFFDVHRKIDVDHAGAERKILEGALAAGQGEPVLNSTRRALSAWWNFLSAFVAA